MIRPLTATAMLGLLAGCTAGNGAIEPPFTAVNLNNDRVQVAVGVATFRDGTKGLNVVGTFRQPDGLSATLLNTPTITGPFTVPSVSSAGTDAGTSHISGSPQALPGTTAVATTFGQTGGVFAYGFAPENSTTSGAASYSLYGNAFYSSSFQKLESHGTAMRGGPPAYPNVQNGTYPTGFFGFTLGYTTFAMAPVAGPYNLSVNVPSGNNPGATLTAVSATLTSTTGLAAFGAAPTFTSDTTGGGTVGCTAPAGVTETIVEVIDRNYGGSGSPAYYTIVVQGGGAISQALADNLGPAKPNTTGPTLVSGDPVDVVCIGADYPLFEAGPPANTSQTPALLGAAGQADVTFSPTLTTTE